MPGLTDHQVLAGAPFAILVDTTPHPRNRPDPAPPPFPGRTLTLQRRTAGGGWQNVDSTTTGALGDGSFVETVDSTTTTITYRVREEDWTANGNQIGWFPSFPFTVDVLRSGSAGGRSGASPDEIGPLHHGASAQQL